MNMDNSVSTSLTLFEFNEADFELIKKYSEKYNLQNFKRLVGLGLIKTESEEDYVLLEPWIQWVSVHTGKSFAEHEVFRLGDMARSEIPQIFEVLEDQGLSVGAISPMNAVNRMQAPSFFIPDPWTNSPTDGSFFSEKINLVLKQVVNDNAQAKISMINVLFLVVALIRFAKIKNYSAYLKLAATSRKFKWRKALFLDLFLMDIFDTLSRKKKNPNFTTLFLNGLAHIQHHYYYNSEFCSGNIKNPDSIISEKLDPIFDAILFYDKYLAGYILENYSDRSFILATGLSQKEYLGQTYYYRLKNHQSFLTLLNVEYASVLPRMTRDFEILFETEKLRDETYELLFNISVNGEKLFGILDKRPKSLFVTLTYGQHIDVGKVIEIGNNKTLALGEEVVLVALKNAEHCATGYVIGSDDLSDVIRKKVFNVRDIFTFITDFFKMRKK